MGGVQAQLAAVSLIHDGLVPRESLHVYTFGAPRFGDHKFARIFDKVGELCSFHIAASQCLLSSNTCYMSGWRSWKRLEPQNKEGILPVATLSIALYVSCRSRSDCNVVSEVTKLSSLL